MSAILGEFFFRHDDLCCNRCEDAIASTDEESLRDVIEYAEDHWNERHGGAS